MLCSCQSDFYVQKVVGPKTTMVRSMKDMHFCVKEYFQPLAFKKIEQLREEGVVSKDSLVSITQRFIAKEMEKMVGNMKYLEEIEKCNCSCKKKYYREIRTDSLIINFNSL